MIDKQRILEEAKEDICKIVSRMNLENFYAAKGQVLGYFSLMRSLVELDELEFDFLNEETEENEKTSQTTIEYVFERKLRGGILPELNNGYFVPEFMVRDLGIDHGDKIKIIETYEEGGITRHRFEVVERTGGKNADRLQYSLCVVEENEEGLLCVKRVAGGGEILTNGNPLAITLRNDDIHTFSITAGDIVDIAFYQNNANGSSVIWKHNTEKLPEHKSIAKRTNKDKVEESEKVEPISYPEIFHGKSVVVIGGKPKEPIYRDLLKKYNATCETARGEEAKSRVRALIKTADVVVVNTALISHAASIPAVEMCKQYKKTYGYINTMGNESFLKKVEELLINANAS